MSFEIENQREREKESEKKGNLCTERKGIEQQREYVERKERKEVSVDIGTSVDANRYRSQIILYMT